jgi:hypothetical protein
MDPDMDPLAANHREIRNLRPTELWGEFSVLTSFRQARQMDPSMDPTLRQLRKSTPLTVNTAERRAQL